MCLNKIERVLRDRDRKPDRVSVSVENRKMFRDRAGFVALEEKRAVDLPRDEEVVRVAAVAMARVVALPRNHTIIIGKEVKIMPGFDGTGPMGMGPMTGGARGLCNPNYRGNAMTGFGPGFGRGGGRGRGYRNMYWATGLPGWMRPTNAGFRAMPNTAPYTGDQEIDVLKNQAKALEAELAAINARLQELES